MTTQARFDGRVFVPVGPVALEPGTVVEIPVPPNQAIPSNSVDAKSEPAPDKRPPRRPWSRTRRNIPVDPRRARQPTSKPAPGSIPGMGSTRRNRSAGDGSGGNLWHDYLIAYSPSGRGHL